MGSTGIEWTDATWNPIRGCSRVSEGCRNCYAEQQAARIVRMGKGKPTPYDGLVKLVRVPASPASRSLESGREPRWTGEVRLVAEHLADPLRWRRGRRVFVNSMSDLFHEKLTNEQIAAVFGVMAAAPQHTFQVLTKRARRMREWFEWVGERIECDAERWSAADCSVDIHTAREHCSSLRCWDEATHHLDDASAAVIERATRAITGDATPGWPLPNVHLGVSVENQAAADERIPELLRTPAAVRFLSCEPLLGDLNLALWLGSTAADGGHVPGIDWVITGCESGPGARGAESAWYRSLRDQCEEAGVPFFLKQATEEGTWSGDNEHEQTVLCGPGSHRKPGGVIGAPYLDGVQHLAFPEVHRG